MHVFQQFLVLLFALSRVVLSSLPPGFLDEGVGRWKRVTDIESLPSPRNHNSATMLLIAMKEGRLELIKDPDNSSESILVADFADLLCSNGERGLQSVVVHPNFRNNRYVYVYYTHKGDTDCQESVVKGPVNRCVRYNLRTDYTLDWSSERVLFQTTRLAKRYHNGGDMVFGQDGYLYIATGDGGKASLSQETSNLMGSLIRLNGSGNIPSDNPFNYGGVRCSETGQAPDGTSNCREIYSYGFRNPFKMALDVNEATKTRIMVNDVGGRTWEEVNVAGTDYPGVNYGWPVREGPCAGNGASGDNVEDCDEDDRFQDPEHYYMHRDKTEAGGGAIVGGAIVPNGYWPSTYDNSYLFADFVFGEIYRTFKFFMFAD